MKPEKLKCKQCNEINWINNSRGICVDCVYKNNHNGKSRYEIQWEKQKPRYNKKGASKIVKNYRKKTGELELFREIWAERVHFCQNFNCLKYLGDEPNIQYFSHRKSKGAYPELRLSKDNIDLLCNKCHYEWDFGDKTKIRFE